MDMQKLNRAQRRKLDKKAKRKLTDEQYKDYMGQAHEEAIEIEVNRRVERVWNEIEVFFKIAMKENRISEDRMHKVFERVLELSREKSGRGGKE